MSSSSATLNWIDVIRFVFDLFEKFEFENKSRDEDFEVAFLAEFNENVDIVAWRNMCSFSEYFSVKNYKESEKSDVLVYCARLDVFSISRRRRRRRIVNERVSCFFWTGSCLLIVQLLCKLNDFTLIGKWSECGRIPPVCYEAPSAYLKLSTYLRAYLK